MGFAENKEAQIYLILRLGIRVSSSDASILNTSTSPPIISNSAYVTLVSSLEI